MLVLALQFSRDVVRPAASRRHAGDERGNGHERLSANVPERDGRCSSLKTEQLTSVSYGGPVVPMPRLPDLGNCNNGGRTLDPNDTSNQ